MARIKPKTRKYYMRMIGKEYAAEHGYIPIDPDDLYIWATRKKKWEPEPRSLRSQFKEEFADAQREETFVDAQDRTVKMNFAVVIRKGKVQQVLWSDFHHASDGHMRLALQQMRRGIKGDVANLKRIQDSWNDNNTLGSKIALSLNFEEDAIEDQHSTEYPDAPPPDDEEDDDDDEPQVTETPV